ncbi:hypothetical protein RDWZM_010295 [Blomia tropicalis]|uniref:Alpha-carbonic anhydrase domain-containing protein n=1 Tax=Blomia tropicalis TaxID=40697 RepID=A0A9Q0M1F3_BLOTA|nr:hypothetical protein RDWZM_010295 [Blomia tropicalis]
MVNQNRLICWNDNNDDNDWKRYHHHHHFHCINWFRLFLFLSLITLFNNPLMMVNADWDSWWTYEGISGPDFWGRLNPKWSHCSKGRRQSPINIDTERIIYDPYLPEINIKGDQLDGELINTGRSISMTINGDKSVLISGGPLSYQYTLSNITLHFGRENNRGSEHTINGQQFAGELQLYAYNGQLYSNWSDAKRAPNGLAAISALVRLAKNSATTSIGGNNNNGKGTMNNNSQLKHIINSLKNITNRGDVQEIRSIMVRDLLPSIRHYVTYDGSLTQPACFETVQWIILNRPIYMNAQQFHLLRTSLKGDGHQDNFRPIQELNLRTIRSNIVNDQQEQMMMMGANHFKYNIDQSSSEESSSQSYGYSKDLCYVNRPVAYKMNLHDIDSEL